MKKLLALFLFLTVISCAQETDNYIFIGQWNLENLFDTIDDPKIQDEEFLPEGAKEWNEERLEKKMYNISRIIRTMNNGNGPDLLGVCEVENETVLRRMVKEFLSDQSFEIAYLESPDTRGIDNGLIFNSAKFLVLNNEGLKVDLDSGGQTRLILHTTLLFEGRDTIHYYVNHWPSRRGGEQESEWRRITAANVLRKSIDEILNKNNSAKIIIVGDFNDEPNNESVLKYLKAQPLLCDSAAISDLEEDNESDLFNLSYKLWSEGFGSFMYQQDFNMLDQIITSKDLLIGNDLNYECGTFKVYNHELMITRTGKFKDAPFPTYGGSRYLGGYSDHFPVVAKLKLVK
jgi:endonuclease/exonuclease/phosphatase family metal-dependent hydrolase